MRAIHILHIIRMMCNSYLGNETHKTDNRRHVNILGEIQSLLKDYNINEN